MTKTCRRCQNPVADPYYSTIYCMVCYREELALLEAHHQERRKLDARYKEEYDDLLNAYRKRRNRWREKRHGPTPSNNNG